MFRKLREQGDGSSGDPAVSEPAPQETPTPESKAPEATPEKGDVGKETAPSVTDLQTQIATLKKTVGDQGNQIGDFKKSQVSDKQALKNHQDFEDSLRKNPASVLQPFADASGYKLVAPSGADPTAIGDPSADQGAGLTNYINQLVGKTLTESLVPVNAMMGTMHEQHLATKYGESWDELTQVRNSNLGRIQGKQIPDVELAHIVSEYQRFPQHIEAAKLAGREELRAELEKKALEHKADPTGQEPGKKPEGEETAVSAASNLGEEW